MKHIALFQILIILMLPVVHAVSLQGPDVTPPTISAIDVVVGPSTVITWETNEPSSGRVHYGQGQNLTMNTTLTALDTTHLKELPTTEGETYSFQITACDDFGNCASSSVQEFIAEQFSIQATIPSFAQASSIDIPGSVQPGATVEVHVNDIRVRRDTIDDGKFLFKNVKLVKGSNTIKLTAALDDKTAERTFTISVDNKPPLMNVSIAPAVTSDTVDATITVSEAVDLLIRQPKAEGEPPLIPRNIQEEGISESHVALRWDPVNESEGYGIYRDGKRVGITDRTSYSDETVASNTAYQYSITSVNEQCVESARSVPINVTTEQGGDIEENITTPYFDCEVAPKTLSLAKGTRTVPVNLKAGENLIIFSATDQAGFTTILEERVLYDTGPPEILEHNLDALSPSYERTVTVRGKLSEQGSVTVFVNGKPQNTKPTTSDGTFEVDITLERDARVRAPDLTGAQTVDTNLQWTSNVYIEAIDAVGQSTRTDEYEINYAICGAGQWLNVEITEPMPMTLIPKLLRDGLGQTGIAFEYEYLGGSEGEIQHGGINIKPVRLAPAVADQYDNNLITPYVQVQPKRGDTPAGKGYIQLNIKPLADPWEELSGDEDAPDNPTAKEAEQYLSDYRRGECTTPALGCMKFFLELEIPVKERIEPAVADPNRPQAADVRTHVQKTCVNVEVSIDQAFRSTDFVPSDWIQTVSDGMGKIIDTIDQVLKPIETIGRYLFYGCVAGTFLSIVPTFLEKYNCEYKNIETVVTGEGAFNPLVAEVGACDVEYGEQTQEALNCRSCQEWKEKRYEFEKLYRQICDRVGCPAAPSLQYYLKINDNKPLKQVPVSQHTLQQMNDYAVDGKIYTGNDCSVWMDQNRVSRGRTSSLTAPSAFFTPSQVEDIYSKWLDHRSDSRDANTPPSELNCDGLHPAHPDCCGYAYVQEWGSACGITAFGQGLDTFDEIKESTCLSAQKVNKNEIPGPDGTTQQCDNVFNAVGGFCDPQAQPTPEAIRVIQFQGANVQTGKLQQLGLAGTREQYMYLLMIPDDGGLQELEYDLKLGYIVETVEFEQQNQSRSVSAIQRHYINTRMEGIELAESYDMKSQFFTEEHISRYHNNKLDQNFYDRFTSYLCGVAGYGASAQCGASGRQVFEQVMSHIGTPDQEYIIRPRDGLINSIRCMCFPALIAYLKQIKGIMTVVQKCLDTIVLTGDGEPGMCQSIISEQVCDLIYEVLTCFTQKFSSGSGRADPAGNIFSALTSAGNEMSRQVEGRYGDSGLYEAVFSERKLTHSVCMFAFTGTWNFDLDVAYDQTIEEFPIDSQALLTPCTRRFLKFDPTTSPPGQVDWIYNFGLMFAAGANVDVALKLQCSGGYKCRQSDGFENGKCDCDTPKEVTIYPEDLPSKVANGDVITPDITYVLKGNSPEGNIRYDKAYIEYSWREGNEKRVEKTDTCTISLAGGPASTPAFCKYFNIPPGFRCQFAEAAGGIRLIDAQIRYPHAIQRP